MKKVSVMLLIVGLYASFAQAMGDRSLCERISNAGMKLSYNSDREPRCLFTCNTGSRECSSGNPVVIGCVCIPTAVQSLICCGVGCVSGAVGCCIVQPLRTCKDACASGSCKDACIKNYTSTSSQA